MATALAWDILGPQYPLMPLDTTEDVGPGSGALSGEAFIVPKTAGTMAIHCPDLGTATLKIQALLPSDLTTWTDVYAFDLTDGTTEALNAIPENQVTVIPVSALGGGVLRFYASADQAASQQRITVVFTRIR